jgi:hypothetical protein
MIEKILYDYLSKTLSVPVYMEVPQSPPNSFVVIEKTGSSERNHIKSAMIAVQTYGASLYQAATLNEITKDAMIDLIKEDEICGIELNSDYNFTDTSMKKYRYQAVFDVFYY